MNKQLDQKHSIPEGTTIFFTAYLKQNISIYYICKGKVIKVLGGRKQLYKVRIDAVGNRPVGGLESTLQKNLLGKIIIKREDELHKSIPLFMLPPKWLERKE